MKTYFIRHTAELLVNQEDLRRLWDENRIAVHYPPKGDREYSSDPNDHKRGDRNVIERFLGLARDGGYVWAESYVHPRLAKIGVVKPNSTVEPFEAEWLETDLRVLESRFSARAGKAAMLKSLLLTESEDVKRDEFRALLAGRPRQGTLAVWHKARSRLRWHLEGETHPMEWRDLTPALQEAACAEFLKEDHDIPGVPVIARLLLPVGRTLEEIDIYGQAEDGGEVLGQVTLHRKDTPKANRKADKLRRNKGKDRNLIFFCRCPKVEIENDVLFFPVHIVSSWAEDQPAYWQKITSI